MSEKNVLNTERSQSSAAFCRLRLRFLPDAERSFFGDGADRRR